MMVTMHDSNKDNANMTHSSSDASTDIPPDQLHIRAKCRHPSGKFEEFRKDEIEQSIPERFEQQVKRYCDWLAVKTPNYQLSYKELNAAANCIGHSLLSRLGEGEEPVAILLQNDASAIIGILGVLKAGKTCVYLEPSYPHSRLVQILHDTKTRLILTNNKNSFLANKLARNSHQLLNVDEIKSKYSNKIKKIEDSLYEEYCNEIDLRINKLTLFKKRLYHTIKEAV